MNAISLRTISSKDIFVPIGFILTVVCILVPLPSLVLDLLQCSNLLFALLLVIAALHIRDPLRVAALPSLLLVATLFRLSLNLATTRAVLGTGHAGQAVEAFGSVVIQGSIVVGAVLFLLITAIQFIVVAKGAERVAEVAARFTLDAMPGKQMAIDAEIRSGLLDPEAARRKRSDVQSESRFYGALDGAMKFVKGDAIAGLLITFVNIVGGLLVGLFIHNLELAVALRRYTVLTIGDGLLSQIPSLLNSVAAGLVVTRVQVDEVSSLASDLLSQLAQFRIARGFVACAAFILGCLPGMPHLALFGVSGLIVASLLFAGSGAAEDAQQKVAAPFQPELAPALQIEVGQALIARLPSISILAAGVEGLREYGFTRWGLVLTRPNLVAWRDGDTAYRVLLRGMEVVRSSVSEATEDTWGAVRRDAERVIDEYCAELIDDGATRRALNYVEQQVPELVHGATPQVLSLTQLTGLLRNLLRERVTTRHLDMILQCVAEQGARLSERALLAEVRCVLAPVVSASVAVNRVVRAVTINPLLDLALSRAEEQASLLAIEVVESVHAQVRALADAGAVVLCSKRARSYLRDLLWLRGTRVPVIAHEEVAALFECTIVGEVEVGSEDDRAVLVEQLAL